MIWVYGEIEVFVIFLVIGVYGEIEVSLVFWVFEVSWISELSGVSKVFLVSRIKLYIKLNFVYSDLSISIKYYSFVA